MPKQYPYFSLLIGVFSLVLSSCGGMDQRRMMETAQSHYVASSLATPPAVDINRDLALLASPSPADTRDYEVGPEDLLEISIYNVEPEDGLPGQMRARVSQRGFVTLPLVGEIQISGLTPARLEQALKEKYGEFMYEPDVGVMITEYRSQRVSVLGAVKSPGVFEITGPKRLLSLLAMAGGITDKASPYVHVSRQEAEGEQTYVIDLQDLSGDTAGKLNFLVRSGDVINIPHAGMFFVDGYVGRPGGYPLLREYTLAQALALAGGLDDYAQPNDVTILRQTGGEMQVLKFDLTQEGVQTEARIVENDVIVVPPNNAKIFITSILNSVGFGVRSSSSFGFGVGRGGGGGLGGMTGGRR